MTQQNLQIAFPSQGWRQILTSRKEILDAYDKAREHAKAHETETYHGRVAEGAIRKWLGGFLPKRYGVTSGYIISSGIASDVKAPHFDVIVYDQIEAPILWIEDNPDNSAQGRSLAIPVEYAMAVLEVKSRFAPGEVKEAITHLRDLAPLMQSVDAPDERYRLYLPPQFMCGMVFVELRAEQEYSEATLANVLGGLGLRGFFGGIVLRDANHTNKLPAGRISIFQSKEPIESTVKNRTRSLGEFGMCKSVQVAEGLHYGAMIHWEESQFSQFAFDLIAMIQGKFEPGRLSSFYGMGNSMHEHTLKIEAKPERIQST